MTIETTFTEKASGQVSQHVVADSETCTRFTLEVGDNTEVAIRTLNGPCNVWLRGKPVQAQLNQLIMREGKVAEQKPFGPPFQFSFQESVPRCYGLSLDCPNGTLEIWCY